MSSYDDVSNSYFSEDSPIEEHVEGPGVLGSMVVTVMVVLGFVMVLGIVFGVGFLCGEIV